MANDMKTLKVIAANGTISFPVVDQTARDAASAAQSAVAKISIPPSLPNPKKLRFTGGATGEYDGSADVTITIPTGGSGGGTVTDEQIGSAVEDYMDDHFGGNTIYYLNGNLEYKPGGVYFNDIASSSLSDEGRGIKAGDFIISSNNVLCKVTSVENSRVFYSQFAQLGASGGDDVGGNTVPDCVITSDIHPNNGSDCNFSVASGSLMNVWEKVHNGEKPRVLFQFLNEGYGDSSNYIAEAHSVEHYASGGNPSWLGISFVVNDELFAFESVSPDSITGNVITSYTVTKLGGVQGGTGMTDTTKNLLITILRNGVYSTDQSANITSLASELGVIESDTPVIPDDPDAPHTHSYTSSVTKAATCETDGVRTYTCSCGNSYTQTIPAIGHNYVDGTCTNCGADDPDAEVGGYGWVSGAEIAYTVIPDEYPSKTDGSFIPEANGYDRTDYIYCYGADYIAIKNGSAYNAFYDVSKRFIRSFGASDYVEIPENAVYFVCSAATLEGFSCKLYKKPEPTWTSGVPYELPIVKNEYVNINTGEDVAYSGWDRTDFVNCVGASKLVRTDSGGDVRYNFFYNSEKEPAYGFHFDSTKKEVEVPKQACYFKLSAASATMDGLVVVPYA